jgi:N-acylglucosamine-6-phosphate 2-epimerase
MGELSMSFTLQSGLIVSCQAEGDSPFNSPEFIVAFAQAAELGGAVAVRIAEVKNVRAVRKSVALPIIGITKDEFENGEALITPTLEDVDGLITVGSSLIALDATIRIRPNGLTGARMVQQVRRRYGVPVIADISTFEEGVEAAKAGAEFLATTLSGYTTYTSQRDNGEPDFELLRDLAREFPNKVIAEGRFWTPEQAAEAMRLGALAVVVGTAITRPVELVRRFAKVVK